MNYLYSIYNKPTSNATSFTNKVKKEPLIESKESKEDFKDEATNAFNSLDKAYLDTNTEKLGDLQVEESNKTSILKTLGFWIEGIFNSNLSEIETITLSPKVEDPSLLSKYKITHEKSAIWTLKASFVETASLGKASTEVYANFSSVEKELRGIFQKEDTKEILKIFISTYFSLTSKEREEYVARQKLFLVEDFGSEENYLKFVEVLNKLYQDTSKQIPTALSQIATSKTNYIWDITLGVKNLGSQLLFSGAQKGVDLIQNTLFYVNQGKDSLLSVGKMTIEKMGLIQKKDFIEEDQVKKEISMLIDHTEQLLSGIPLIPREKEILKEAFQNKSSRDHFNRFLTELESLRVKKFELLVMPDEDSVKNEQEHLDLNSKASKTLEIVMKDFLSELALESDMEQDKLTFLRAIGFTLYERITLANMQMITDPFILVAIKPEEAEQGTTLRYLGGMNGAQKRYIDKKSPEYQLVEKGLKPRYETPFREFLMWEGFSAIKDPEANVWNFNISHGIVDKEIATAVIRLDLSFIDMDKLERPKKIQLFKFVNSYLDASKESREKVLKEANLDFLTAEQSKKLEKSVDEFTKDSFIQINKAILSVGNPTVRFDDIIYTKMGK